MVKYEDFLDGPVNTTNTLLDKLQLPHHPGIQEILGEVEKQQLDQVMMWTGDPDKDISAWIGKEQAMVGGKIVTPNVYLDQDLITKYITVEMEEMVKDECGD